MSHLGVWSTLTQNYEKSNISAHSHYSKVNYGYWISVHELTIFTISILTTWHFNSHQKSKRKFKLQLLNHSLQASEVNENSIWSAEFRHFCSRSQQCLCRPDGIVQIQFIFCLCQFFLFVLCFFPQLNFDHFIVSVRIEICFLLARSNQVFQPSSTKKTHFNFVIFNHCSFLCLFISFDSDFCWNRF